MADIFDGLLDGKQDIPKKMLKIILTNPLITQNFIQEQLKIDKKDCETWINKLKKKGLIETAQKDGKIFIRATQKKEGKKPAKIGKKIIKHSEETKKDYQLISTTLIKRLEEKENLINHLKQDHLQDQREITKLKEQLQEIKIEDQHKIEEIIKKDLEKLEREKQERLKLEKLVRQNMQKPKEENMYENIQDTINFEEEVKTQESQTSMQKTSDIPPQPKAQKETPFSSTQQKQEPSQESAELSFLEKETDYVDDTNKIEDNNSQVEEIIQPAFENVPSDNEFSGEVPPEWIDIPDDVVERENARDEEVGEPDAVLLLLLLGKKGPQSREEAATALNQSIGVINKCVSELKNQKLIVEEGGLFKKGKVKLVEGTNPQKEVERIRAEKVKIELRKLREK